MIDYEGDAWRVFCMDEADNGEYIEGEWVRTVKKPADRFTVRLRRLWRRLQDPNPPDPPSISDFQRRPKT